MKLLEIFLICLSLSIDNFAVATSSGCSSRGGFILLLKIASIFCIVGIICLLGGFFGGTTLANFISSYDHLIASLVLAYIGIKMIFETFRKKKITSKNCLTLSLKSIIMMALATNIDVLAIGISLAFYKLNIWIMLICLSCCILIATITGFYLGVKLGKKLGKQAEVFGGIILLLLSLKILLQG